MPVYLKNSVFLHVPKTGGIWVAKTLTTCVKVLRDNKDKHKAHIMPDIDEDMGCFAFVRHPVSWIESLYNQRKRKGWNWQQDIKLERECQARSLECFINNISDREGIIEDCFDHYIGKYKNKNNFIVGKTEHLSADLINILRTFEEKFDEKRIRARAKNKENTHRHTEPLPKGAREKIYNSQRGFYDRYNYDK